MTTDNDARLSAPATERNREPILAVLDRVLPPTGTVLEVASGTGEHAVFFAPRLKPRFWFPTEPDPRSRASIVAWMNHFPSDNLFPPIDLDVRSPVWSVETSEVRPENLPEITAIVAINLIHISPWDSTLGLMSGAGRILPRGGILYLYGAFKKAGKHTSASNAQFDEMLQLQNPAWGVRDLDEVVAVAAGENLTLLEAIAMPANNWSVVFQHR